MGIIMFAEFFNYKCSDAISRRFRSTAKDSDRMTYKIGSLIFSPSVIVAHSVESGQSAATVCLNVEH